MPTLLQPNKIALNIRTRFQNQNQNSSAKLKKFWLDRMFCTVHWNPIFGDDGVLVWTTLLKEGRPVPFTEQSCPLVSMVYKVPDVFELKQERKQEQNFV